MMPTLWLCFVGHGEKIHLTDDLTTTLCKRRVDRMLTALGDNQPIQAAAHWLDRDVCVNCRVERLKYLENPPLKQLVL